MKNNNINSIIWLFLVSLILLFTGCSNQKTITVSSDSAHTQDGNAVNSNKTETIELTVSAATSLTHALKEIKHTYETHNKTIKLNYNFGASGALQQQIEQGAPVDIFLAAANKNMKALIDKQLIDTTHHKAMLSNELVIVTPAEKATVISNLKDLTKTDVRNVAIGIPESVPAGNYAKEALIQADLWQSLQTKIVNGKDVRQILQYIETGNADAGFVYKTDALTSQKVKIASTIDPTTYSPILYPVGIVKATKHSKEAQDFYKYLHSQEAIEIFVKYGFTIPKGM